VGKSKNGLPKFGAARERAQGLSMRVRREQKAAAEAARFGAHFTPDCQILRTEHYGVNFFFGKPSLTGSDVLTTPYTSSEKAVRYLCAIFPCGNEEAPEDGPQTLQIRFSIALISVPARGP